MIDLFRICIKCLDQLNNNDLSDKKLNSNNKQINGYNKFYGEFMPSHIELAEYGLKRIRKIYSSDLLDEIIIDLHFLIDSGIYGNLLEVYYNWEEPVPLYGELNTDIALKNDILVMAIDNLKNFPIKFLSDLIDYGTFYFFFPFLE